MRVLWFSCSPSCYDVDTRISWVAALEKVVRTHLPEVDLGIVFEHSDKKFKEVRDGVTYYPIYLEWGREERIRNIYRTTRKLRYERLRPHYLAALKDFNPDIVQCFGTELWHYSLLQKEVDVPFVVHMMGFWHIYAMMGRMVERKSFSLRQLHPLSNLRNRLSVANIEEDIAMERESMLCCHHFMGRTEWDRAIVRHMTDRANYYHCPEAIREDIYNSSQKWQYKADDVIRLITVSNAGLLKGNEIMLHAAWLLKNKFGKKVEWCYTSSSSAMKPFEKTTGIRCDEVGIKLIGRLNANEIPKAICDAEMFIHCSVVDNSPNAICEAQLLGCPVVASNAGGIPQIVIDGETGFLYPYAEPYALAFKILDLHNNQQTLEYVSRQAYEKSHERHCPQTIAKCVMQIYMDILKTTT